MVLRELIKDDWPAVKAIYEEDIAGGRATFETEAPSWNDWDRTHLEGHRLVMGEPMVPPWNQASLVRHKRCGFRVVVGLRERIGKHHGVWRDVVFMERRSP